jgi:anhydro-N-acetylmuramic acid kinase
MSGTSADGVDAVCAEITEAGGRVRARVRKHISSSFSKKLRERILRVSLHGTVREICELNFELGERFAKAALRVIEEAGLKAKQIFAIGSHGQTIHHLPGARFPSTLQIGEPAVIAEQTGVTTVADFRVGDMAAGGQGAPLVPYADLVLFGEELKPRIVQNIGGIANLTFLPKGADPRGIVAFDTGPGNMIIDGLMQAFTSGKSGYDRNGVWAKRGTVERSLLAEWMRHPFVGRIPPKTTGREEFGEMAVRSFLRRGRALRLRPEDIVATATAFTAACISDAYRRFVFPQMQSGDLAGLEVILGGGGAKNPTLRSMLIEEPPSIRVLTHEDFGIDNQAKEALAFAILAHETMRGRAANIPSATGARLPVVLGKIVPGARA